MTRVTFYVGQTSADGTCSWLPSAWESVDKALVRAYGGFSKSLVSGAWENRYQEVIKENTVKVEVLADNYDPVQAENLAWLMKSQFAQEKVLFTVEPVKGALV
jgi:hypothetical protein